MTVRLQILCCHPGNWDSTVTLMLSPTSVSPVPFARLCQYFCEQNHIQNASLVLCCAQIQPLRAHALPSLMALSSAPSPTRHLDTQRARDRVRVFQPWFKSVFISLAHSMAAPGYRGRAQLLCKAVILGRPVNFADLKLLTLSSR